MKDEIQMIAIDRIRVLNPRVRDKKKFAVIVESIRNVGLKKPIQVSLRSSGEDPGYDLVCGQGRMEAFIALGHREIPAVVVQVSKEERLLRSLIENMARRYPTPLALMNEIDRLKKVGYSNVQISEKLGVADTLVGGFLYLKNAGEERLLDAALAGRIPLGVAMDIAKTEGVEAQRALLKAYESKQLNQVKIRMVKQIIDQRCYVGKKRDPGGRRRKERTSAESLVAAYKRESQRQRMFVRKARVCEAKLLFVVRAFRQLMQEDHFRTLLRAESLSTMPKYLSDQVQVPPPEVKRAPALPAAPMRLYLQRPNDPPQLRA